MFRIAICYGQPKDTDAFDEHYTNVHVPLAAKVPGLSSFTTGKCSPMGRGDAPYYMVANLGFETAEAMKTAMRSPEMAAAGADVPTFATGGVTMYHYEEVSRAAR